MPGSSPASFSFSDMTGGIVMRRATTITGAGLGLRRGLVGPLRELTRPRPDYIEVTPENWIGMGGRFARDLRHFTERYPTVCHGLSLNLGGSAPLDAEFIGRLGKFLDLHHVVCFSEHLSYCADEGHLYDLIPLPFTTEAVRHVSARIRQVQEQIGRRIAVENVSFYAMPEGEMSEADFLNAVLEEADCELLLDVNNVYVNSVNHGYDAEQFIASMPSDRLAYLHIAGHLREAPDLIIDTHGDSVIDTVWSLLETTYAIHGVQPTLLERDFNLPPLDKLLDEVDTIRRYQAGEVQHATK
jgi:uncharacterized protein (UPF0276 family)